MSVLEIYDRTVRPLSAADRIQLARMILNDLPAEAIVDFNEAWSEEDLREFSTEGWAKVGEAEAEGTLPEIPKT